jgi:hypothetical protein
LGIRAGDIGCLGGFPSTRGRPHYQKLTSEDWQAKNDWPNTGCKTHGVNPSNLS